MAKAKKNWIKGAIKHPGALTKKAKKAGVSVPAYVGKVLKPGSKATPTTKKQASLARTLAKIRKGK